MRKFNIIAGTAFTAVLLGSGATHEYMDRNDLRPAHPVTEALDTVGDPVMMLGNVAIDFAKLPIDFAQEKSGALPNINLFESENSRDTAVVKNDADFVFDEEGAGVEQEVESYACTKTLDVGGDVQSFSDSLTSGQTGCLRGGTYDTESLSFRSSGAIVASYPGERATLNMGSSGATLSSDTEGMVLKRLNFVTTNVHTIRVFGSKSILEYNYFTNENAPTAGACVGVGSSSDQPDAVIVRGNKFENCGGDKLNHGIYALSSTNLQIIDNIFWGGRRLQHTALSGSGQGGCPA